MKLYRLFGLLLVLALGACSPGDAAKAISMASQANVLSVFKMTETFQAVRMTDKDGFARSLAALKAEGYSGRQLDAVVAAQALGKSVHGYVFKDIVADERGGPLNNDIRYGLFAVPETQGEGSSFMLLIDLGKVQISDEGGTSNGIGGELYKSEKGASPGERWPSAAELAAWEKIARRSPQEALKDAKELKQKYDEGRR